MSCVNHAGPVLIFARSRLKNPRTPPFSVSSLMTGMIPAVATLKTDLASGAGRNTVRIIGGMWRGRKITFPTLPGLRPTPDRVRETLFNWLQHSLSETRCLDLFAGSGALGLEALSRGAQEVVFVEQAPGAVNALIEQIKRLDAQLLSQVVHSSAKRYLSATPPSPFDVVFLDPPFETVALDEYLPLLSAKPFLKEGSLIYLESPKTKGIPRLPAQWQLLKSKSAGEVGYYLARVVTPT